MIGSSQFQSCTGNHGYCQLMSTAAMIVRQQHFRAFSTIVYLLHSFQLLFFHGLWSGDLGLSNWQPLALSSLMSGESWISPSSGNTGISFSKTESGTHLQIEGTPLVCAMYVGKQVFFTWRRLNGNQRNSKDNASETEPILWTAKCDWKRMRIAFSWESEGTADMPSKSMRNLKSIRIFPGLGFYSLVNPYNL